MTKTLKAVALVALCYLGPMLILFLWAMNAVKLFGDHESTGMAALRVVGLLFAPLGAVLGLF